MSKRKQAAFHIRARETLLKRGMMDYCVTGGYAHFAAGDAYLTDERFYFSAELDGGDLLSFEVPLSHVYAVECTGIPFLTRSMLLYADEGVYRLNAFFVGRWVRAVRRAVSARKEAGHEGGEDRKGEKK